jgi:hypothetical protein
MISSKRFLRLIKYASIERFDKDESVYLDGILFNISGLYVIINEPCDARDNPVYTCCFHSKSTLSVEVIAELVSII